MRYPSNFTLNHVTVLEFLGWKLDFSKPGKWENPSKGVFGTDAPDLSLDLAHEAETKFTAEQHALFRDALRSVIANGAAGTPEDYDRAYVSAEVEDRTHAIAEVIELGKLAEEADKIADAKDAEKAEESELEQSEEPAVVAA